VPVTRLIRLEDADPLAALQREHRAFFAPYEPLRDESYFTAAGQAEVIATLLERHRLGQMEPRVILAANGSVAGRITLDAITKGAFQSCGMGYWVAPPFGGQGLATTAVAAMADVAFRDWGLHRIEAGAMPHNMRSRRVLAANQFQEYGLAPRLVHIAGQWRDHVMYQRLNDDWGPPD
jgi:[ribosomal protein S5]-alanine N-acetyltransferase